MLPCCTPLQRSAAAGVSQLLTREHCVFASCSSAVASCNVPAVDNKDDMLLHIDLITACFPLLLLPPAVFFQLSGVVPMGSAVPKTWLCAYVSLSHERFLPCSAPFGFTFLPQYSSS
jgi:hypothetical protein